MKELVTLMKRDKSKIHNKLFALLNDNNQLSDLQSLSKIVIDDIVLTIKEVIQMLEDIQYEYGDIENQHIPYESYQSPD